MRVAIMQPTYLPWLGYLDLMDQVDSFIFLDDVAFSSQSWQQRNRIRTASGLQWLTVPVLTKGRSGQPIREVELRDATFWQRHISTIRHAYSGTAPRSLIDDLESFLGAASSSGRLLDINLASIRFLRRHFGVTTPTHLSSEVSAASDRIDRLITLVQRVGGDRYVTPPGSVDYLRRGLHEFQDAGMEILVHAYAHPHYQQRYAPFLPQASALDALLCEPEDAPSVLRSGRQEPRPLASEEGLRG